mmetsp:Transcript_55886/g.115749  ORF Transcript_55886/g.115749 Transcript_55886/m.115749 type:complete len:220 (-) Transcript_55886:200-859(-)
MNLAIHLAVCYLEDLCPELAGAAVHKAGVKSIRMDTFFPASSRLCAAPTREYLIGSFRFILCRHQIREHHAFHRGTTPVSEQHGSQLRRVVCNPEVGIKFNDCIACDTEQRRCCHQLGCGVFVPGVTLNLVVQKPIQQEGRTSSQSKAEHFATKKCKCWLQNVAGRRSPSFRHCAYKEQSTDSQIASNNQQRCRSKQYRRQPYERKHRQGRIECLRGRY